MVYCERFTPDKVESMKSVRLEFARAVDRHCLELRSIPYYMYSAIDGGWDPSELL